MKKNQIERTPESFANPQKLVYACVGNGLSLTREDVDLLNRPDVRVIAINDVYAWAEWAWALYAADYRWWNARWPDVMRSNFRGKKFTVDDHAAVNFKLDLLICEDIHVPMEGLSPNPDLLRHGYSGGAQAMQIPRMFGAKKIILLGYDYGATGQGHAVPGIYFATPSDFMTMVSAIEKMAPQFAEEGIDVVNCTRESALTCFRKSTVEAEIE